MKTLPARAFFVGLLLLGSAACNQGAEGDRCNPDLSHDECNAGLSCQQPKNCPENYCCPIEGESTSAFCQPGCAGGLAAICAAEPSYDACVTEEGATDASKDSPDDRTHD
jgi:hypothetical protein